MTARSEGAPRVQFEETVALIWKDHPCLEGAALNLSRGGMFVRSERPAALPGALRVLFQLPGGGPIDARAAVVRVAAAQAGSEPQGVGLRFEAMSADCAERLREFIAGRLEPASGERLRLELSELGSVIGATAHSCCDDVLSVEAALPFLRVGSPVQVHASGGMRGMRGNGGTVRWVAIHADPVSGIPRLNIGIGLVPAELTPTQVEDEPHDPVLTDAFAAHALSRQADALK